MVLAKAFYQQPTIDLAQALLGKVLVHEVSGHKLSGKIVETEAYLHGDPANHAFGGQTARNHTLFQRPGMAYIYQIYGQHYCLNVTSGDEGIGEAVLLRAIEPIAPVSQPTNGPAKLVKALGIPPKLNGHDLTQAPLYIAPVDDTPIDIVTTTRIGVTKATSEPLRFSIRNNPFVSKR